jgi:hypothetical protein
MCVVKVCSAKSAVEDRKVAKLLALERILLFGNRDEKKFDSFLCSDESAGGCRLVRQVCHLNDDVEGLVEDVLPARLAAHVGLLVLSNGTLATDHDFAPGIAFELLQCCTPGPEKTADKIILWVLLRRHLELDAFPRTGHIRRG